VSSFCIWGESTLSVYVKDFQSVSKKKWRLARTQKVQQDESCLSSGDLRALNTLSVLVQTSVVSFRITVLDCVAKWFRFQCRVLAHQSQVTLKLE
jgi:hypothetical protein